MADFADGVRAMGDDNIVSLGLIAYDVGRCG